jgi:hypothetical protein
MKLEQTNSDIKEYGKKYHFYYNEANLTVVCTTMYKGQLVRGIAKCDPDDNFNIDLGKTLAYMRCKVKFARKKFKHSLRASNEAFVAANRAKYNLDKAREFMCDSEMQLTSAIDELKEFEEKLDN